MPAAAGVNGARGGDWRAVSARLAEVNTGVPVQVVSPGANSLKVTVPVGLNPPLTVAVSQIERADRPARRGRGRDGRDGLGDGHRLVRAGRS